MKKTKRQSRRRYKSLYDGVSYKIKKFTVLNDLWHGKKRTGMFYSPQEYRGCQQGHGYYKEKVREFTYVSGREVVLNRVEIKNRNE